MHVKNVSRLKEETNTFGPHGELSMDPGEKLLPIKH